MQGSVAEFYKEDSATANRFSINVVNLFIKSFGESMETFIEYERDTPLGRGQVVFALGKMICDVLGIKNIFLAQKISESFLKINKIELSTTEPLLTMPINEARNMVKSIAIQHGLEEWGIQWHS